MILEQMVVGSMAVCCYILGCEKTRKAAVVDPGGDEGRILHKIDEMGLTLEMILLTHSHPDHVCGNRTIKEATGAKIVAHQLEAEFMERPEIKTYFSMLGLEASPPVDQVVDDGDFIEIGEEKLEVILTPGHTPGGICFYNAPNLITGDTLFAGGIGRTDFPGGSYSELINAIRSRLFTLPKETVVWPGHGYGGLRSTIGDEAVSNPFL